MKKDQDCQKQKFQKRLTKNKKYGRNNGTF